MNFLSHPAEPEYGKPAVLLLDHLKSVSNKTREIVARSKFESKNLAYYTGLFHDLGKLGPYYQKLFAEPKITSQRKAELAREYDDFHAIYSCWIAKKILKNKLDKSDIQKILMLIYCHHGEMKNPPKVYDGESMEKKHRTKEALIQNWKEFIKEQGKDLSFCDFDLGFDLQYNENIKKLRQIEAKNSDKPIAEFVELGFLFSALLQADKGSFTDSKTKRFDCKIDTASMKNTNSSLSAFRTKFQEQVAKELDPENPITIINAPTGIGKTKAFLDAIDRFDVDRVFYFSPLLALTNDIEEKILKNNIIDPEAILTYNHTYVGTLESKENKNNENFTPKWNFDYEAFNEKFIITTMHRLLMTIYSNKNRDKLKLASLTNALLIVDEVQTLPKFLLKNLCEIFKIMAEKLGTKVVLVSATIPFELSSMPTIKMDGKQNSEYLRIRNRKISLGSFEPDTIKPGKSLIMLNTRKNARQMFERVWELGKNAYYITSGITKKHQNAIIEKIKDKAENDIILVSTQVIEAGVDVSFTNIWRQMAPLDNIVQVLGRLDRENKDRDSTLYVFHGQNQNHIPYSSLEYTVSEQYLKNIKDSVQLYEVLPRYYEEISKNNQTQEDDSKNLHHYISKLNFEQVWEEVRNKLSESHYSTVYVPDQKDWDRVRNDLLSDSKNLKKKYNDLIASMPRKINGSYFDEELLKNNILLPKKEMLTEIYDETVGLDKWIS